MPRIAKTSVVSTIALVLLTLTPSPLSAQEQRPGSRSSTANPPRKSRPAQPRQPAGAQPKGGKIKQVAGEQRAPRPQNNVVMKPQKLDAGFLRFLDAWEKNTSGYERLKGGFEKYVYNKVFNVETRGLGEVRFQAPDQASLEIKPMENFEKPNLNAKGLPFRVQNATPERWVVTGKEIFQINDKEKTYSAVPIPEEMRGERISEGPIPFLFGLKAEEARERFNFYRMEVKEEAKKSYPNNFWFMVKPRKEIDRQEWVQAMVILDVKRFLPTAIKLIDPAGTTETVYHFKWPDDAINPPKGLLGWGQFIQPNLKGYKPVMTAKGNAKPPAGLQPPAGGAKPGRIQIGGDQKPAAR